MRIHHQMVIVAALLLVVVTSVSQAELAPEVVDQIHPDVLSGQRPTIKVLRQSDIFDLREAPRIDADLVRLSVIPGSLTTSERTILMNWLRSGSNRIYLNGYEIKSYENLFGYKAYYHGTLYDVMRTTPHVVNRDCRQLGVNMNIVSEPEGLEVIGRRGEMPASGRFTFGETEILFHSEVRGNDAQRWMLNYNHWALGMPVPSKTITNLNVNVADVSGDGFDHIVLKNGHRYIGTVTNQSVTVQRGTLGDEMLRCADLRSLTLDMDAAGTDRVSALSGADVAGQLTTDFIGVRLRVGGLLTLPSANIKRLQFRVPASMAPSAP